MANALSPSTNSPTIERRARGPLLPPVVDDAHSRPHWSAVSPIERLFDSQLITAREKTAAIRFRGLWDAAFASTLRAANWNAIHAGRYCGKPGTGRTERQADAIAQLTLIRRRLGTGCFSVVEGVVIEEWSWASLARRLKRCPRTAKSRAAAAIAALAAVA